jgi:membrane protein DedA with SNARE-associated domain
MRGPEHWLSGLPPQPLCLFIFVWLFVESVGFPISDEPILLLAGYLSALGHLNLVAVIFVALVGKGAASCVAWWIGRQFDLERIERPAERPATGIARGLYFVRPTEKMTRQAEAFFDKRGAWSVFLGRLVPVARSFISSSAGAAGMPSGMFLLATTAGSLLWITESTVLGAVVRHSYRMLEDSWRTASLWIIAAMIALVAAYWLCRRLRNRRLVAGDERAAQD